MVDYSIGTTDGVELVRTAVSRGADVAIVMLSGYASRELDLQAIGAEIFLEKERMAPTLLERSIRLENDRHRDVSEISGGPPRLDGSSPRDLNLRPTEIYQSLRNIAIRRDNGNPQSYIPCCTS